MKTKSNPVNLAKLKAFALKVWTYFVQQVCYPVWFDIAYAQLWVEDLLLKNRFTSNFIPVLNVLDIFIQFVCKAVFLFLKYYLLAIYWLCKLIFQNYPKIVSFAAKFIFMYSVLAYISSTAPELQINEALEPILKHANGLFEIASDFIQANIRFINDCIEAIKATPVEENAPIFRWAINILEELIAFVQTPIQ